MESLIYGLGFLLLFIIAAYFFIWISLVFNYVPEMAKRRGRSVASWIIIAIFCSPFVAMICLKCLGASEEFTRERWRQQELSRIVIQRYLENAKDIDEEIKSLIRTSKIWTSEKSY